MAQQSNAPTDLILLVLLGAVGYFAWQKDWIQTGLSAADQSVNPQDFEDNSAPGAG